MASSSSSCLLEPVADLPSSCTHASHYPPEFITDVGLTNCHAESKVSPSQQADGSPSAEVMEPEVTLPEDILWKIHSLMPMQDAARAACLSRSFFHSWRCYPKLIFDMRALRKQTRDFIKRVDHIMWNHSGVGVETFKLQTRNDFNVDPSYLDHWLQVAITPGIKEFVLLLPIENTMKLDVENCKMLQMIECSAPDVSIFNYDGSPINMSLGGSLQLKTMQMTCAIVPNLLHYASTKLLSIALNVQTLFLHSLYETVNTPMVLGKFVHLRYLEIKLFIPSRSPDYDFCSLVSFLDASPILKTFVLRVEGPTTELGLIPGVKIGEDSSLASCVRKRRHRKLKSVIITGFCPWKTMIELTRCIIHYATSLKNLVLDTTHGYHRRRFAKCYTFDKHKLIEARKALAAIRTYIEGKVPSKVNFKVLEPCNCNKCQEV
ncbi:unnamed protein product [Alopecurus aequalis]